MSRSAPVSSSTWLLPLLLVGCGQARAPLDLDGLDEASSECVTVIHESLELGGELHRFISDGPGSPGGWGLISIINDINLPGLAVVRVPASPSEALTAPIELGMSSPDPKLVELRAGSEAGEAWISSQSANVAILRRIVPEQGVIASNSMLANYPVYDDSGECPTKHHRTLVLIEGRPYLLALPNCGDGPALNLHLLGLDRETLAFITSWELSFDPCAAYDDPLTCAQSYAYLLSSVSPGTSTLLPEATRVPVGFVQVREFMGGIDLPVPGAGLSSDISMLDMRMTASGPSARLVTFREVWTHAVPLLLGPVELAQDPYSTQIHVRNLLVDDDAALLRFDTVAGSYVQLRDPDLLPFAGRGQLVQLSDQAAIVDLDDGLLQAAPLADIDRWPFWSSSTLLELDDLVSFEVSGVAHLLLRREAAPPQLVYLSCLGG